MLCILSLLACFPSCGTHPKRANLREGFHVPRCLTSLVSCPACCRPNPVLLLFLLPFTSSFPGHQFVALQLAQVVVARRPVATRWRRTKSAAPGKLKFLLVVSFLPISYFRLLPPRLPFFPTPHRSPHRSSSDRPKPKAKLRPHQPLPLRVSIVSAIPT
ncbi:hypothetical protein ACQKWADRAFT_258366 [Trichoderma austrokoningii]